MKLKPGWYLIYVRFRHEKSIASKLYDGGVKTYLPVTKTFRKWHDRNKYIDLPLFPCYLFVFLTSTKDYLTCLNCEGFLYFVGTGKQLSFVDESIVDNIRITLNAGESIKVTSDSFRPGQQLVISQGLLTGLCAETVDFKGNKKVLIRVNLLNRNILMNLPAEYLSFAGVPTTKWYRMEGQS
jgi:transcriptional antiterminator RfaH